MQSVFTSCCNSRRCESHLQTPTEKGRPRKDEFLDMNQKDAGESLWITEPYPSRVLIPVVYRYVPIFGALRAYIVPWVD